MIISLRQVAVFGYPAASVSSARVVVIIAGFASLCYIVIVAAGLSGIDTIVPMHVPVAVPGQ